jgi:hypothetical protein
MPFLSTSSRAIAESMFVVLIDRLQSFAGELALHG